MFFAVTGRIENLEHLVKPDYNYSVSLYLFLISY